MDIFLGPTFIDGNLTAEKYLSLLQNEIFDLLHNSTQERECLENAFPGRVIATNAQRLPLPPRSLELNPLDFFFVGLYQIYDISRCSLFKCTRKCSAHSHWRVMCWNHLCSNRQCWAWVCWEIGPLHCKRRMFLSTSYKYQDIVHFCVPF